MLMGALGCKENGCFPKALMHSLVPRQRCSDCAGAFWSSHCAKGGVCPMLWGFYLLEVVNPLCLLVCLFSASSLPRQGFCRAVPCGSSLLISAPELLLYSGWWETLWMRKLLRKPKQAVPEEGRMGRWHFSYQIVSSMEKHRARETFRALPNPNLPPGILSRTQQILSLHHSVVYPFITS